MVEWFEFCALLLITRPSCQLLFDAFVLYKYYRGPGAETAASLNDVTVGNLSISSPGLYCTKVFVCLSFVNHLIAVDTHFVTFSYLKMNKLKKTLLFSTPDPSPYCDLRVFSNHITTKTFNVAPVKSRQVWSQLHLDYLTLTVPQLRVICINLGFSHIELQKSS